MARIDGGEGFVGQVRMGLRRLFRVPGDAELEPFLSGSRALADEPPARWSGLIAGCAVLAGRGDLAERDRLEIMLIGLYSAVLTRDGPVGRELAALRQAAWQRGLLAGRGGARPPGSPAPAPGLRRAARDIAAVRRGIPHVPDVVRAASTYLAESAAEPPNEHHTAIAICRGLAFVIAAGDGTADARALAALGGFDRLIRDRLRQTALTPDILEAAAGGLRSLEVAARLMPTTEESRREISWARARLRALGPLIPSAADQATLCGEARQMLAAGTALKDLSDADLPRVARAMALLMLADPWTVSALKLQRQLLDAAQAAAAAQDLSSARCRAIMRGIDGWTEMLHLLPPETGWAAMRAADETPAVRRSLERLEKLAPAALDLRGEAASCLDGPASIATLSSRAWRRLGTGFALEALRSTAARAAGGLQASPDPLAHVIAEMARAVWEGLRGRGARRAALHVAALVVDLGPLLDPACVQAVNDIHTALEALGLPGLHPDRARSMARPFVLGERDVDEVTPRQLRLVSAGIALWAGHPLTHETGSVASPKRCGELIAAMMRRQAAAGTVTFATITVFNRAALLFGNQIPLMESSVREEAREVVGTLGVALRYLRRHPDDPGGEGDGGHRGPSQPPLGPPAGPGAGGRAPAPGGGGSGLLTEGRDTEPSRHRGEPPPTWNRAQPPRARPGPPPQPSRAGATKGQVSRPLP